MGALVRHPVEGERGSEVDRASQIVEARGARITGRHKSDCAHTRSLWTEWSLCKTVDTRETRARLCSARVNGNGGCRTHLE